jgi:hypothetical protein
MITESLTYGRRRGPVALPTPPPRDLDSRIERFRPVVLNPQTWPHLLRDETPVGCWLDVGRA